MVNITNNLRVIRHAWHFYYALVLVIKVVCGESVLRASHLNWALGFPLRSQNVIIPHFPY
ncbi:DUF3265 domain-containing protein [Vibrio sp. 99-70-13A1]|nr:DUF3265 domain-containing protein [Vibrio sp. 99-70-13A1]